MFVQFVYNLYSKFSFFYNNFIIFYVLIFYDNIPLKDFSYRPENVTLILYCYLSAMFKENHILKEKLLDRDHTSLRMRKKNVLPSMLHYTTNQVSIKITFNDSWSHLNYDSYSRN